MRTFLRLLSLVLATVLLSGCGQQDEVASQQGKDEVVVHLSAGDAATSRAAFTKSQPVTVLVYQRSDNNLNAAQYSELYKRVEGTVTTTAAAGGLSSVNFSGGNLTVEGGHTYDFVLVVNMPKSATLSNGVISDIPNNADIMIGRADNYDVPKNASSITVNFTKGYATEGDGNLPHLASKVVVSATADDALLGGNHIRMGVGSVKFYGVQGKASFNFGSTPMVGLTLNGKTGSYFELVNSDLFSAQGNVVGDNLTQINSSTDKAVFDKGTLLPMPLPTGATCNPTDIDFTVYFYNGTTVTSTQLAAKSVELPELKPGYQYTFNIVMRGKAADAAIDLYLSVEPWNSVSWDSSMGGDSSDAQLLNLKVGSWSSASWNASMGSDTDGNVFFLTGVSGWSNLSWTATMGED